MKVKDGQFLFVASVSEPTRAMVTVRLKPANDSLKPRAERLSVFIEPGTITITVKDSLALAKVTGSKSHKAFEAFTLLEEPYTAKSKQLNDAYSTFRKEKNEAGMKQTVASFEELDAEKNEQLLLPYLQKNPGSPIALYVLGEFAGYDIDAKKVEPLFAKLPVTARKSPSGLAFKERIETAKKTGIGVYAMEFTQNDTLGKPVSLSSFKGKYVLIDFWASWCGPCRVENPNVVKAFQTYKDKGFTVLGISLDQPGKKQAWMDAIHKDELTWTHLSDLQFWDNAVAKQYGIRAIPQNLLLDPSGKIVARNIRGEELTAKLETFLGK